MQWQINTSNPGKLSEFKEFFGADVEVIQKDLEEPDADPITVVRYKASQFENVIVDDVSLYIEGETVGANIRWLLDQLPKYVGKKAKFVCLIAIKRNNKVEIYEAEQKGEIVAPKGDSYGFNNYFLPDGADKTFGEHKPNHLNPRWAAVQKLLAGRPTQVEEPLLAWTGAFQ